MARLTLDELRKKREDSKKEIYLREGEYKSKIIVHMGTGGIAAGRGHIIVAGLRRDRKNDEGRQ